MSELADRAKASLEGVTEGPWVSWKDRESRESYSDGYVYRGNIISDSTKQIVVTRSGNAANSLFIAAARQLVPELIAEVERLEAEVNGLEGLVSTLAGCLELVTHADTLRRYR